MKRALGYVIHIKCWTVKTRETTDICHSSTGKNVWQGFKKAEHWSRDQNRFRQKSLKACNAELGGACTCLLNDPQMKHTLSRGFGGSPPEILWLLVCKWCIPVPFLVTVLQYLYPLQNFLFRFTPISRMDLGAGKKSQIRLKSENFDPCKGLPDTLSGALEIIFAITVSKPHIQSPFLNTHVAYSRNY